MRFSILVILLLLCGVDSFSQLYNTGLVFDDAKYATSWVKPVSKNYNPSSLPGNFSLKAYCPRPGNQLQMNNSAVWATTWSALGILTSQRSGITDPDIIAAGNYSPAYVMANIKSADDPDCQKDLDLFDALNFIFTKPIALHRDINDFCPSRKELGINPPPLFSLNGGFTKLIGTELSKAQKIFAVKKSVSSGYPVVIGMRCPPSFQTAKTFWKPAEYDQGDFPGQALCIVGYDDNKYGGAFEVINSWGSRWGNDGFMWIRYDDYLIYSVYAYDVFLVEKPVNQPYRLSGSVQLRLNSEKEVPLKLKSHGIYEAATPLTSGTFFRLYLQQRASSFVYVFGVDEANEYFSVFPHQDNICPAVVYPNEEFAIPGEDNYIRITGNPGKEQLYILYTHHPLDFAQFLRRLKAMKGDIYENISTIAEGKLMKSNDADWDLDKIAFTATSPDHDMLLIRIDILHR